MPSHDREQYYDLLYADHDYDGDCDLVESLLTDQNLKTPFSILDIGYGTGQHSIRLAKRGHRVVGIDVSDGMLERAKYKALGLDLDVKFHLQDMREMGPFGEFDCAICLFGAFARIYTDQDILMFFDRLNKLLRHGGLLVLDFVNADGFINGPKSWRIIPNDDRRIILLNKSRLSGRRARDHHEIFVLEGDLLVDSFVEEHDLQTRTFHEIEKILREYGYPIIYPKDTRSGSRIGAIRMPV